MEPLKLSWQWTARQLQALHCPDQFLLYGGAKGGGKSVFLVRWAAQNILRIPGNKGFLARKRGVDFNNTTLETFKRFVDPRLYKINEHKKKIFFPDVHGVIDYGGLDDQNEVEKFNSAEYGFIGIDQAEEISRDDFAMLRGTLRFKTKAGVEPGYHVRLTANPSQGWLKEDFILFKKHGYAFVKALPSDNSFLPKEYANNLEEAFRHRPELLQAYLYGSWDDLSGSDLVCQLSWIEKTRHLSMHGDPIKRVVVCDPARFGDDETMIYVMEQKNIVHTIFEEGLTDKSLMETVGRLVHYKKRFDCNLIASDGIGIGAGIIDALNEQKEDVLDINSSSKPTTSAAAEKYLNLRAQIWLEGARKIYDKKVLVPNDPLLIGQLSTPRFKFSSGGKMQVEAKEEIKKRINRSPDRADAFLMGLHALDHASELNRVYHEEDEVDRQGRGQIVNPNDRELYCSPDEDSWGAYGYI